MMLTFLLTNETTQIKCCIYAICLFLHHIYCSCFSKSRHNNYSRFVISLFFKLKNFLTLKKLEKKKNADLKNRNKSNFTREISLSQLRNLKLSSYQLSCNNFYVIENTPKFEDLKFVIYIIEYKFTEIYV